MGICDGSTGADLLVEYSDDPSLVYNDVGHTWVDIKDVSGTLDVTGGDKAITEKKTFGNPRVGLSQPGPLNVVLDVLFENDANSFLEYLTDLYDGTVANPCFWLRWSYAAGASGALRRTAKVAGSTNPFTGGNPDGTVVSKNMTFAVDDGVIYRDAVP